MDRISDIIKNITNTLGDDIQLIMIGDPRLSTLKHIASDYLINDKDLCSGMVESHISKINSIDELEMYVQQHYDVEDLLSIYKRAFMNG
tara:strand:- start:955 stop:1221 length:267 start_codon:yes stop_codon:yes gene_type:complete